MTQQTTMDRIFDLILSATQAWTQDEAAEQIAAEIDALTRERDIAKRDADILQRVNGEIKRERDEARAEVERLRPAAAAYNAYLAWRLAPLNSEEEASAANAWIEADKLVRAARRAA